jgi:hypothetical protein
MLNWKVSNLAQFTCLDDFQKAMNIMPNCLEVKLADFGFARFVSPTQ